MNDVLLPATPALSPVTTPPLTPAPSPSKQQAPRPLTPRRENYIRALASGLPSHQAAIAAGYSASYAKAVGHRLSRIPAVRTAVESIQMEGRKAAVYDLAKAMSEAQEVIAFAKKHKNSMAYCKAVELRTRLSGLSGENK